MQPREYADYVADLESEYAELAGEFTRDSVEAVLDWIQRRGLPPGSVELVGQDEFSYDFLIRLEPERKWLVFGVN